jgi:hypothetical protein
MQREPGAGGMALVAQCLPSKHTALNSNPGLQRRKEKHSLILKFYVHSIYYILFDYMITLTSIIQKELSRLMLYPNLLIFKVTKNTTESTHFLKYVSL